MINNISLFHDLGYSNNWLSYKYIDTAWIKWSLIVMIGGAFYYATIDDLKFMFIENIENKDS